MHYWNDISSFASPHFYLSPKASIQAQIQANQGNPSTLQVRQADGTPVNGDSWHVSDSLIQSVLPSVFGATINAMQSEVGNDTTIPLVVGEFGASYPGEVANPSEQAAHGRKPTGC
jgi:hypothetical protein